MREKETVLSKVGNVFEVITYKRVSAHFLPFLSIVVFFVQFKMYHLMYIIMWYLLFFFV